MWNLIIFNMCEKNNEKQNEMKGVFFLWASFVIKHYLVLSKGIYR